MLSCCDMQLYFWEGARLAQTGVLTKGNPHFTTDSFDSEYIRM